MKNNHEEIYKLAAAPLATQNLIRLVELRRSGCIDEFSNSNFPMSAAARLASEGKPNELERLVKNGARSEYIAFGYGLAGAMHYLPTALQLKTFNWFARGLAQGKFREFAEKLRKENNADVNAIAAGAARSGFLTYTQYLHISCKASVLVIAASAAVGGHTQYAEGLRIKFKVSVHEIASAAAQGWQRGYAEFLRKMHKADVTSIAVGAARGGFLDYAEFLRIEHKADLHMIAGGAAYGGHRQYAEFLRATEKADVNIIAYEAARGLHTAYAEFLRSENADVNHIAAGAVAGNDIGYADQLVKEHGARKDLHAPKLSEKKEQQTTVPPNNRIPAAVSKLSLPPGLQFHTLHPEKAPTPKAQAPNPNNPPTFEELRNRIAALEQETESLATELEQATNKLEGVLNIHHDYIDLTSSPTEESSSKASKSDATTKKRMESALIQNGLLKRPKPAAQSKRSAGIIPTTSQMYVGHLCPTNPKNN